MPDTELIPALIDCISDPIAGVRFVTVLNPADGEPILTRRCLGLDRRVLVHHIEVWHHRYTNVTDHPIEVSLGRRTEVVKPGDTVHYTGRANPSTFPVADWHHDVEPVVVEPDTRVYAGG